MRVLAIAPFLASHDASHLGGFFIDLALAASRSGCDVGLVAADLRSLATVGQGNLAPYDFGLHKSHIDTVELYQCKGWRFPLLAGFNAAAWRAMAKRAARKYLEEHGKPDIIHAHWALRSGEVARELARDWDVPYVVQEHFSAFSRGTLSTAEIERARLAFSAASGTAAVSRQLARDIGPLAGAGTVEVIPNVLFADRFPPRRPDAVSRGDIRFITVCNLVPEKGVDVLLHAFARLLHELPDAVLEIAGDGPERRRLEALRARLGLGERVVFHGRVAAERVPGLLHAADAFVLASRHETFGVVLLEALACGLPVIASATGGARDIIDPDVGMLVSPGDAEALAKAMLALHAEIDAWRARPGSLRDHVLERYSPQLIGKRLVDFYHSAIAGYGGGL